MSRAMSYMRRVPGFSVTSRRPSGRKVIAQGSLKLVTCSTWNGAPSTGGRAASAGGASGLADWPLPLQAANAIRQAVVSRIRDMRDLLRRAQAGGYDSGIGNRVPLARENSVPIRAATAACRAVDVTFSPGVRATRAKVQRRSRSALANQSRRLVNRA